MNIKNQQSSTDATAVRTKTKKKIFAENQTNKTGMCHMSHVTFHLSFVNCHMSATPTATVTDPPPALFHSMHRVGWLTTTDTFVFGYPQNHYFS